MKKNIKLGLLGLAAAVLFGAQIALGATLVQVGDKIKFADGPGASPGGAFILTVYGSAGTIAQGSFQSFCLEKNEYISYSPAVFNLSAISNEARAGGAGGQITTPYPHDPLDVRTAWLYTQYRKLSAWATTYPGAQNNSVTCFVHKAIQEMGSGIAIYIPTLRLRRFSTRLIARLMLV